MEERPSNQVFERNAQRAPHQEHQQQHLQDHESSMHID